MAIYNALQIKAGAKVDRSVATSGITQPVQFLPQKEKDEDWCADNLNWFEMQGIKQLSRTAPRLLKNYKLSRGIIDRTDYVVEQANENADLIEALTQEDVSALELKFYPIIPTVLDVLCAEFSKRKSKVEYRSVDELSYNEMLEEKRKMVEDTLLQQAYQKMITKLAEAGVELNSEEAQQQLSTESLKSLPEIESFFKKSYRSIYEEWAQHQHNVDDERFKMFELEERAFRDMLVTDREFWHFRMMEDDYEVELWNPAQVFYHKAPGSRYISDSQWVGMIDLMTPADVIDRYGWMMDKDQLESLENAYPVRNLNFLIPGLQNDGSFYDPTKTHESNTQMPSLAMRQYLSLRDGFVPNGDIVSRILSESEDSSELGDSYLIRVATVYWKSQRKVGHLTKISEQGELIQEIIDENYRVTDKPQYDTTLYKTKTKDNLVFGEHIDWIWINEIWGGIKIGPNRPTYWSEKNNSKDMTPIYLGVDGPKPGRVKFQFKGDNTLYGCKPPVEGAIFSDRNTKSIAPVDRMKPFQVAYNIVNNQIQDILVDELGTIILFDQNALPRHSMGEDWGKGNLQNAYIAMKNFQMLPVDTSIQNTENGLNFQHYQVLNMEQTNRLIGRINLANYFKQQALEAIGFTPQRLGQQLSVTDSAKGIEMGQNASYVQTEMLFTQHSDYLMPRVHQMRTELAQYYNSTKPSLRLQYLTSRDERIAFETTGTNLLLRDLNVFCTTRHNSRAVMEQLRQLALNNNTAGGSIYDLGNILKADSLAEMDRVLKSAEDKVKAAQQQQFDQEQQMHQQEIESAERQHQETLMFEADQNDKQRENNIVVAEIRAATTTGLMDVDKDGQNDYMDALDRIQQQQNYNDQMNFEREKEGNKSRIEQQKLSLTREEMRTRREIAEKQLQIARANKNKYDVKKPPTKK